MLSSRAVDCSARRPAGHPFSVALKIHARELRGKGQADCAEHDAKAHVDTYGIALMLNRQTRNVEAALIQPRPRLIQSENWNRFFVAGCEFEVASARVSEVLRPVADAVHNVEGESATQGLNPSVDLGLGADARPGKVIPDVIGDDAREDGAP
jgi:hypothetical protein